MQDARSQRGEHFLSLDPSPHLQRQKSEFTGIKTTAESQGTIRGCLHWRGHSRRRPPHAFRPLLHPKVWPAETRLPEAELREPCEHYYEAITRLMPTVLAMLARSLPHGPHIFVESVSNTPAAPIRLLQYPLAPAGQVTGKAQFGSSAHTDIGTITLMLKDRKLGLEVYDVWEDLWVPITANPDAYVVNMGDMLSKWTSERYKSSLHRVVHKSQRKEGRGFYRRVLCLPK